MKEPYENILTSSEIRVKHPVMVVMAEVEEREEFVPDGVI